MYSFLYESPVLLTVCGLTLVVLAALFWTQTGNRPTLYAAGLLAALTLILLLISLQVVTPREEIKGILDEVAAALESNDREKVYSYIHPNAQPTVQQARTELPNYEFQRARVTRIKLISVNPSTQPRSAIAEFNVVVNLSTQGQQINVPRFIKVYFMENNGRWLVTDYEHHSPMQGFQGN
ncbi:hypothetical protein [Aureliella helgolandensis]|uniref:Lumazine-binding domain protein n=1 Tax=Aureliella helgolandensis TaxID=2527968 RepID=A0A518G6W4_9BACT|nr:hypothetical protein [Aureliella helgolandensis]QDV24329.1 hypothetical protein Q31a_26450 [Aureliella helgolandensis]